MKILLYGDFYLDASGFAKELKDIIPELLKAGHEVRQVALRYSGLPMQKTIIPCYPTRVQGVKNHWSAEVLELAIEEFKPDIVLTVQDYFVAPHLTSVLAKPRKFPCKWVAWTLIDGGPLSKIPLQANAWAHHHIFQTEYARDTMEEGMRRFVKADADFSKNEVIYPAVDLNVFKPIDKEAMRKELQLEDRFVLFFLARNQFRKNTPVLFEAVKKLSKTITNIQLLIHSLDTVRPDLSPDGYDLQAIVENLGIQEHICEVKGQTGRAVTQTILNKLYNAADVFVLPTMGEGFGLPLQEAMAAGLPCIATDCSATPEILGDGRGMLVRPAAHIYVGGETRHAVLNADDLANAVYKMWENQPLREEMAQKGHAWVQSYSPDQVTARLLQAFEKVLAEDKQPLAAF